MEPLTDDEIRWIRDNAEAMLVRNAIDELISLRGQLFDAREERNRLLTAITTAFGINEGETWEITDGDGVLIVDRCGSRRRVNVTRDEMNELNQLRKCRDLIGVTGL